MPTIWTYLRATAVVVGSSAALLTGGIAHADPAPAPAPAPDMSAVAAIPQQLIASAANAPQILQNLATALGATPPAAPAAPGITFPGLAPATPASPPAAIPSIPGLTPPAAATPAAPAATPTIPGVNAPIPGLDRTGGAGGSGSSGGSSDSGIATVHPWTHHPGRTCLRRPPGVRAWGGEG